MTVDATAATVSQPLKLSTAENLASSSKSSGINGNGERTAKKRKIRPSGKITLTSLTDNNLGTLKTIILTVCDKHFSDKVYKAMLEPSLEDINKLVYYNDIPVGAILCRMVPKSKEYPDEDVLEIAALAVLARYRSLGLGTALLNAALEQASSNAFSAVPANKTTPAISGRKKAMRAILHVEEENVYNKSFYVDKCGFEVVGPVDGYYKDRPNSKAWLLQKSLKDSFPA